MTVGLLGTYPHFLLRATVVDQALFVVSDEFRFARA
jgi:hypothetical protein